MLLKRDLLELIKAGEVDLIFRRWNRQTVKPGGTLKTKVGLLAIKSVTDTTPDAVTDAEAQRAGFRDVADFRRWLDTMKEGSLFQRIEVGYIGEADQAQKGVGATKVVKTSVVGWVKPSSAAWSCKRSAAARASPSA